ncbi:hypothetical protein TRFO_00858 [Tritrichomonas foetus]|uniref:Uncharacterized protein n=1 Tax=Tritrichomonas foetus TaxID=1144522 RepID=A0A1J4L263_9EUKA|nr:hypothetical protein TRFO_00858 [Tritrichomonas foetus]|eukprot:OHT17601.1 hypothetical protein TRFO_00858 [Tritrichomonas foetus]
MFDTSSDFDHLNSHDHPQESETDMQLLAESQAMLLREQNETLTKENASLRAQFEEALRITKQVEEIHQKNRELKTQVRDYQSQLDNLNQRMEISTRTIDELNQKIELEKTNAHSAHENEQAIIQKEIQKAKSQAKAQVDNLLEQVDQLSKSKEKTELEQKMIHGKIERCLDNAQHYFHVNFRSFDDLISFLSQSPIISTQQEEQVVNTVKTVTISAPANISVAQLQKLGKRLKREKAKLKEQLCVNDELETLFNKMKREQQDSDKRHQQELDSLRKELEQQKEDASILDSDQKHQISLLKAKIETLKSGNAKRNVSDHIVYKPVQPVQQQQPVQIQQQHPQPQPNVADSYADYEMAIDQMTQRNNELSRQLRTVSTQRDELATKVRELENLKHEFDINLEKSKNELNALSIVHKETVNELESVRSALHEREVGVDKKEKAKLKREMSTMRSQINNLQSSLDSQKKQTYELTLANEQSTHTISQLNLKLAESRKVIEEDQRTIENLKDDLHAAQHDLEDKPSLTPDDIMPPNVWRFPDFGSELSEQITKVIVNTALQPASKLQNIYRIIYHYYSKLLGERDSSINNACNEIQSIKHAVNQFLVNVSISLGMDPITFEDFFAHNGSSILANAINQIRSSHDEFKRLYEQYTTALTHFFKTMNMSPDSDAKAIIDTTNRIRDQLNAQTAILQKRSKKCHEINLAFKLLKRKYNTDVEELTNQSEHLHEVVDTLTKTNNNLTAANQQIKRELQSLKVEYRDYRDNVEERETTLSERYEDEKQAWNNERQKLISQIHDSVYQVENKYSAASTANGENENVICRLRSTIASQKATLNERDNEIAKVKREADEAAQNILNKAEREKKQLIESYEKAVNEITAQCNTHRNDVERLAKTVTESEKKLKQAKAALMQLKRDNVKVTSELQAQKEQSDREKKLAESSSKTAILNVENNCNSKLDEQKAKFDAEKRRLYAYVADTFKQFFNPHDNIDERSFKNIVTKARDELARLVASDVAIRRFVGASTHQKTDDAVAQLLMTGSP